jgi:hypothetical protein
VTPEDEKEEQREMAIYVAAVDALNAQYELESGMAGEYTEVVLRAIAPLLQQGTDGWIGITDRLPNKANLVLMLESEKYRHLGFYAQRWRVEADNDNYEEKDWLEYNEDNEGYFLKEGWYSEAEDDDGDYQWRKKESITHWQPLPPNPQ